MYSTRIQPNCLKHFQNVVSDALRGHGASDDGLKRDRAKMRFRAQMFGDLCKGAFEGRFIAKLDDRDPIMGCFSEEDLTRCQGGEIGWQFSAEVSPLVDVALECNWRNQLEATDVTIGER